MNKTRRPILYALVAALCYGCSTPLSKLLLDALSPSLMAALLYLGAGFGMALVGAADAARAKAKGLSAGTEARVTRRELPYVFAMVGLDIAAPILLMLGLARDSSAAVSAGEISGLKEKLDRLGALAEQYIDIESVLALAASAPAFEAAPPALSPAAPRVRIAVAKDEAFCFLYQENLELLGELGCELVFFSPMRCAGLPENIGGLYLPGGYPELHFEALSGNAAMRRAVKEAVEGGLPTIAECGGFLYLHDALDGFPMAGVIHAPAYKTEKLQRFGYVTLRATADNLLCAAGESIRAHEFHYYGSADNGSAFLATKASSGKRYACSHASATLYVGFPHLYFPANPAFAANFVKKAAQYARV